MGAAVPPNYCPMAPAKTLGGGAGLNHVLQAVGGLRFGAVVVVACCGGGGALWWWWRVCVVVVEANWMQAGAVVQFGNRQQDNKKHNTALWFWRLDPAS